jgi:hypothetical protein
MKRRYALLRDRPVPVEAVLLETLWCRGGNRRRKDKRNQSGQNAMQYDLHDRLGLRCPSRCDVDQQEQRYVNERTTTSKSYSFPEEPTKQAESR